MTQEERNIFIRCQNGDKDAFRWVVQIYQQRAFALAMKLLCDEEEAKDIVQETFIRAWKHMRSYDLQRPFATWMYTIASHLCMDRIKTRKAVVRWPEDEAVLHRFAADTDSQRTLENSEWVTIVRTLAEGLSDKQRLVFTLCQLEGLTSAEVEQIAAMDAKQVKNHLFAARQTIRKRLKDLGYE